MKLFLWGAPCSDTAALQHILSTRGYQVRSLRDITCELSGKSTPRQTKQLRALDMIAADAVVIDYDGDRADLKRCAAYCQELGVSLILSDHLPVMAPIGTDHRELIDSLDQSFRVHRTPIINIA